MILDTAFFLDVIAGDAGAVERAQSLEEDRVPQRVPAQVIYELFIGVGCTEAPDDEVAQLSAVLSGRPVVETTAEIAKRAGRMDGQLRRDGERLPTSDLIIGATALHYDEPVVTADLDHFGRMPGVEVVDY